MPLTTVFLWIALLTLAALGPGPCLVASLRCGLANGPRAMVETGIGFGISAAIWTLASLFGVASLLSANPLACDVITKVGGVAVVVVGIVMIAVLATRGPRRYDIKPARTGSKSAGSESTGSRLELRQSVRRIASAAGLHAVSPGTPVFFVAVTPVLMASGCSTTTAVDIPTALALAATACVIFIGTHSLLSRVILKLRELLQTRRRLVAFELTAGLALVGAGVAVYF